MTTDEPRPDDADRSFDEYADLGATTENAMDIATSMDRVRELVPDETLADRVSRRACATGDRVQHLVRFTGTDDSEPVRAGARAVLENDRS